MNSLKFIRLAANTRRCFHTTNDSLVLLHVIFRHGDRTPDVSSSYPNDPYKNHDYSPYGHGQLTNPGKQRAYHLGKILRERYGNFLGDIYRPDHIDAWASEYDRTKMTLQLVLASLYPPRDHQVWDFNIPWQPIPYKSPPKEQDEIFLAFLHNPLAIEEYNRELTTVGPAVLKPYEHSIKYVEKHAGLKIENPRVMFAIACTLATQQALGLELPTWTEKVWPHRIEEIAMKEFDILTSNARLKGLIIGKLFDKIMQDTKSKIEGKSNCKIHLYSGHDFTVGMFLKTLDIFQSHHPDFCSNIVIELHSVDGEYLFKIMYQSTHKEEPKEMIIPGCGLFCPISSFSEKVGDILDERTFEHHY